MSSRVLSGDINVAKSGWPKLAHAATSAERKRDGGYHHSDKMLMLRYNEWPRIRDSGEGRETVTRIYQEDARAWVTEHDV